MGPIWKGIGIGVAGTILVAVLLWMAMAYSGVYNVSAADQHADVVRWTLDTAMHRSVEARADEIVAPENISQEMIADGASHYAEACVHCHGAPGEERAQWALGMRPMPPELTEAAAEWELVEIQWIVTNGLKMTGMPAFGEHHSTEEIATIAAFVNELPGLTPEDYASLRGTSQADHGGGHRDAAQPETAAETQQVTLPTVEPHAEHAE